MCLSIYLLFKSKFCSKTPKFKNFQFVKITSKSCSDIKIKTFEKVSKNYNQKILFIKYQLISNFKQITRAVTKL